MKLYRFFKKKNYRDEFLTGAIRFGKLQVYKSIEDEKRRDIDEGEARGKYKTDKLAYLTVDKNTGKVIHKGVTQGDMSISGTSLDHNFILCLSDENVDLKLIADKLGRFVVVINDVDKMLDLLNKKCRIPWKVGRIVLMQVKYDKDKYIEMDKESQHLPFEYFVAQKPETFADEHEQRIVLTGSAIEDVSDEYITIEIGDIKDIATKLDL